MYTHPCDTYTCFCRSEHWTSTDTDQQTVAGSLHISAPALDMCTQANFQQLYQPNLSKTQACAEHCIALPTVYIVVSTSV